jgi:hypothetical protein
MCGALVTVAGAATAHADDQQAYLCSLLNTMSPENAVAVLKANGDDNGMLMVLNAVEHYCPSHKRDLPTNWPPTVEAALGNW